MKEPNSNHSKIIRLVQIFLALISIVFGLVLLFSSGDNQLEILNFNPSTTDNFVSICMNIFIVGVIPLTLFLFAKKSLDKLVSIFFEHKVNKLYELIIALIYSFSLVILICTLLAYLFKINSYSDIRFVDITAYTGLNLMLVILIESSIKGIVLKDFKVGFGSSYRTIIQTGNSAVGCGVVLLIPVLMLLMGMNFVAFLMVVS